MTKSKKLALSEAIEFMMTEHGVDYLTARNVLRRHEDITEAQLTELLQRRNRSRTAPLPQVKMSNKKNLLGNRKKRTVRSRQVYCKEPYNETRDFVLGLELE